MPDHDIRCTTCHRLLARLVAGRAEIRQSGRLLARVQGGDLVCPRCLETVAVETSPSEYVLRRATP
jgi:phage FluMu protein Com